MKKFNFYRKGIRFIKIYAGLAFISLIIFFILFNPSKQNLEEDYKEIAATGLNTFSTVFLDEISQLSTDIFLITDLLNVHDSLVISNGATEFTTEESREIIETEFLVWMGMKQAYDQIRIIDNEGQEIVRVNYNSGLPFVVEVSELQNKFTRYYFTESIA